MDISIFLYGPLRKGQKKEISLHISKDKATLHDVLTMLEKIEGGAELVNDGYVVPPYILIVDDELVKGSKDIEINENTKIQFMVMIAGGSI